MTILKIPE